MRYRRVFLLLFVFTAAGAVVVSCRQEQASPAADEEPLLLLDEGDSNALGEWTGPLADNSRCHVCHINYAEEKLAVTHARAEVGCEDCHGPSYAHCGDEDNVTPPDTMYPVEKINPACMGCHTKEKIEVDEHRPFLAAIAANEKVCTNCHGEHRLGYRTRRWDKTTGKLIQDDKVRMTTQ
ncbi:MAG: ammonia-forming cytochrome c nitrite reductase subunit c552 [Phycisphaerales bacterium]|nr:MAG: ammonia-forming cytochrome c nitrite reductase subunit c552 [Phycisphaerales bacterium]